MSNQELLLKAISDGKIDIAAIKQEYEMAEKIKYLEMHNQKIWQGNNGYWYTYLLYNGKRKLVKKSQKKDIEKAVVSYYKRDEPTLQDIFYEWINERKEFGEIENGTYDRYESDFKRYFNHISDKKINSFNDDILEEFIKKTISEMNLTRKNWSNMSILINGIFKYAKKHKYTNMSISSFMGDLVLPKKIFTKVVKKKGVQVFMDEEVDNIFNYVETKPTILNLAIKFALLTGLRSGEISTLMKEDLDGYLLNVSRTETRYKENGHYVYKVREYTKGSEGYRTVILTDEAVKTFNEIIQLNPTGTYLVELEGQRVKAHGYSKKVRRICRSVNIPVRSMHKCRRTYATTLLNNNVAEKLVTQQMGHTDILTTKEYYWYNNQKLEDDKSRLEKVLG